MKPLHFLFVLTFFLLHLWYFFAQIEKVKIPDVTTTLCLPNLRSLGFQFPTKMLRVEISFKENGHAFLHSINNPFLNSFSTTKMDRHRIEPGWSWNFGNVKAYSRGKSKNSG